VCKAFYLYKLHFLNTVSTDLFLIGTVAMHVRRFSGCSIHSMLLNPDSSRVTLSFFKASSFLSCRVTFVIESMFAMYSMVLGSSLNVQIDFVAAWHAWAMTLPFDQPSLSTSDLLRMTYMTSGSDIKDLKRVE
jgi:hypothetical protein